MRATLAQSLSVAANVTTANLMNGKLFARLSRRTKLVLAAAAAAAGLNHTLIVGGKVLINDEAISQANRFPLTPDDISAVEMAGPGEIVYTVRNTTGAAVVLTGAWIDAA